MGEFLDSVIEDIYEFKFEEAKEQIFRPKMPTQQALPRMENQVKQEDRKVIFMQQYLKPYWQILMDEIVMEYEPIYHSSIIQKLKKIAKIK